jgi:hypothetical protein
VVSAGLADNDPQMAAAFDGVYLIRLDTDVWGWGAAEAGFEFEGIPVFFRLGYDGKPTGDKIDGGAWGPDTYENIANTMGPWFRKP